MKLDKKVHAIVAKLKVRGVNPLRVNQGDTLTDPAIWITESIYIQVNEEYVVVFKSENGTLSIFDCTHYIKDIIRALKEATQ